jgi:hypothetical protein
MKKKTEQSKKVSIEFDEKHLATLVTALEVYSRLRGGQIKFAFDNVFWDKDLSYQDGQVLESFVRTIVFHKDELLRENRNAYYGIGCMLKDDKLQLIYNENPKNLERLKAGKKPKSVRQNKSVTNLVQFDADGKINITRLNELGMDIINRRKGDFEALKGLDLHNPIPSMNLLPLYDSINSTIDNGDYVISYTNSDINWFCGEFQRGLSSCSTPDDIRIYVSKLDEAILSSDLNEETKGSMLMTLSVLENSTHFWYE